MSKLDKLLINDYSDVQLFDKVGIIYKFYTNKERDEFFGKVILWVDKVKEKLLRIFVIDGRALLISAREVELNVRTQYGLSCTGTNKYIPLSS